MTAARLAATPTRVTRANPLTLVAAGLLVAVVLLCSLDLPSAAAALVAELLLLPLAGTPARVLRRRALPLLVTAALTGATIVLYGRTAGVVHAHWGPVTISDGSLLLGAATAVRLLAIALPAVVLLAGLDATRLADALGQRLHLPARFVVAALAAARLTELFAEDWRTIALARRARGVGDTGAIRRLPGQVFGLLVVALRRSSALATAMEARGFGRTGPRTWARPSTFGRADLVVSACAVVVATAAVSAGILSGVLGAAG